MDEFVVIPCHNSNCRIGTWLPLRNLREIEQHRGGLQTGVAFIDFVCPQCGCGWRHETKSMETRQAISVTHLVSRTMYRASLRCVEAHCASRVTVHTVFETDASNGVPKVPAAKWILDGPTCADGHRAQQPIVFERGDSW